MSARSALTQRDRKQTACSSTPIRADATKCIRMHHFSHVRRVRNIAQIAGRSVDYDPAMPLPFDPFPKVERGTPGAFATTWHPIQKLIAGRVKVQPLDPLPRFVAGADCAFTADKRSIHAVVLVWDRIERKVIEVASEFRAVDVP